MSTNAPTQRSYLVTGASGFIGSRLVKTLVDRVGPSKVTALIHTTLPTAEATRAGELRKLGVNIIKADLLALKPGTLTIPPFDVLYHLAGYAATEDPNGPFRVNDEGTRNLLTWASGHLRDKRVVFTGTLASIDQKDPNTIITEDTPCKPVTAYGQTKLRAEEIISQSAEAEHYRFTILRLCTVVGRDYRAGGMFDVFPALLRRGALATRLNWPGHASFMDVDDVVNILLALLAADEGCNALYLAGTPEKPTFDELLELISECVGAKRSRVCLPKWIWSLILHMAWMGAESSLLGYKVRIFCWRVCHLVGNGLYANPGKLLRVYRQPLRSLRESLWHTYSDRGVRV